MMRIPFVLLMLATSSMALACPKDVKKILNAELATPSGFQAACGDIEKGYVQVYKTPADVKHIELWKLHGNAMNTYKDFVALLKSKGYVLQPQRSGNTKDGPVDVFVNKASDHTISAHLFGDEEIGLHVALRLDW
ncbi:hypothetical protein [Deinococcus maricopensis]|uniref:Lipoprotein n=1 Tax=Deinococcus maricopensis (strain DSM 21211 / LMG 22137 / NRRL B-23946 / LB-34) TaxID=709986 RepID=E8UAQ4_DEIML|nr:hypothetical protein [Deinococcus maricopensis]ADV68143.1 hypothetical protein Deima_2508 [Deinococcus maricopensis DSM 21211]